jgi:6-pyruvoyltetrahydropterin/6-carboxytetrahydropterin synthase
MITANRYHDISCGHRVYGHESKCAHLHGHNYRVHFTVAPEEGLDNIGRVLDFSVIKTLLAMWLEDNYDHKFLVWEKDPILQQLLQIDPKGIVAVSYNPTAENIAKHLVEVIAPIQLKDTGCKLMACTVEETRKCSATYEITKK